MKQAHIITDLGFGDSGKGVVTDRLCHSITGAGSFKAVVVRHTGGSQAGHTVDLNLPGETDPLKRHIHASFASGTLGGYRSHMSQFCPIYPQNLVREARVLETKMTRIPLSSLCSVDPLAPMITHYDVAWNRATTDGAHNTVGIGIGTTMERMLKSEARTFMADLLNVDVLNHKLKMVYDYYSRLALDKGKDVYHKYLDSVYGETVMARDALDYIQLIPTNRVLKEYENVIFEGAQGIMLDQDHGFIPNVTWGYTTSRNAVELIRSHGKFEEVTLHYVTRAYQTRHGDGPMTSKGPVTVPADPTNFTNPYQGHFRTGELDPGLIRYALAVDQGYVRDMPCYIKGTRLHVTCCDHLETQEIDRIVTDLRMLPVDVSCWFNPRRTY